MSNLLFTGGSSLVSVVVSYAANSLWQVPLVSAAGWAASRLLRRLGPQAQHVVWVATLLLAVAMPAVPRWHWHANTGTATVTVVDDDNFVLAPLTAPSVPWWVPQNGVAMLPGGFFAVMLLGYLGALVYFAGRFGWSLYWTSALEREAAPMEFDAEREALWLRCRAACGVSEAALLRSEGIDGPVTVGFGEPALLVPTGFAEACSQQELLALLAHECAHIKRRDFQKNVAYEAASLLIAFHPVTWMVKQQIAQTREMICDGMAVEKLIDAPQYMRALLRMAAQISFTMQGSTVHAIGIFDANVLEKRIIAMKRKRRQVSSAVRFAMIAAGAAVLTVVAMAGSARAVAVEAKAAPVVTPVHAGQGAVANHAVAAAMGQAVGGAETPAQGAATVPVVTNPPALARQATQAALQSELKNTVAVFDGKNNKVTVIDGRYPIQAGAIPEEIAVALAAPPPTQKTAAPAGPARVSGAVIRGNCEFCPDPAYPPIARAAHVSGTVVLHALISKEGIVQNVQLISGPNMLAGPAMETVRTWRYKPYMLEKAGVAKPTAVDTTISVNFSIGDDGPPTDDQALPAGVRHVGGGVSPPVLLHQIEPEYTERARADKVDGDVVVGLYVGTDGVPTNVHVIRGLGDGMNEKAIEAVMQYRFKPAMENGQPVMVDMNVVVNFRIF